jgi:hypothetical protein
MLSQHRRTLAILLLGIVAGMLAASLTEPAKPAPVQQLPAVKRRA